MTIIDQDRLAAALPHLRNPARIYDFVAQEAREQNGVWHHVTLGREPVAAVTIHGITGMGPTDMSAACDWVQRARAALVGEAA